MKNNIFKQLFKFIGKSVVRNDQVSSSRMSSYFILGSILTTTTVFIIIEIVNAFISWESGIVHTIPGEHIIIFGMILAHHLTLLGINKSSETKIEKANQEKLSSTNKSDYKSINEDSAPRKP